MYILFLIIGLVLLYYGAEFLVRGSSTIAFSFGMKKIVVGLTVVALGTSMPEFVVSLSGALNEVDNVSVGNIVGSNLANFLLVLGITCIISPITTDKETVFVDLFVLIIISFLFVFFCYDGMFRGTESIVLLTLFIFYIIHQVSNRKDENTSEVIEISKGNLFRNSLFTIAGIIGLVLGGKFTVIGAVDLAQKLSISNLTIGLTVVAIGTSLPELFTSVIAAVRHEHEISIGNLIGSNIFNISFVLGIVPIISPLKISPDIIKFDNWFMLGITIFLAIIVMIRGKISRFFGFVLLLLYILFMLNLVYNFI